MLTALLDGCASISLPFLEGPPDTEPPAAAPEVREDAAADVGGTDAAVAWWTAFDDPVLQRFVGAVLDSSFDLDEAVARLEQAHARRRIASASRWPTLQGVVGGNEFDIPANAGIGAQLDDLGLGADTLGPFGLTLPERLDLTTYTAGAEFAYEVDFWGRRRNEARAADAEAQGAASDLEAARIRIVAEAVGTYLEVVDLRHRRALAGEMVTLLAELERLTADRYVRGLTDAGALYATRRQMAQAEAEAARTEVLLAGAEGRLWILAGGRVAELDAMLPQRLTPALSLERMPDGIDADLVVQRPDVRAAQQRVQAARYSLDAHGAALLPSLSLSGSIGLQGTDPDEWFDPDQWFRNLSVNLLAPVLQGGRLRGNVDLAAARLDEAVAAYGRSVATAVTEVTTALAGLDSSLRLFATLTLREEEARSEASLQRTRYEAGVADYATFLMASRMLAAATAARAAGLRDLGLARVTLHRAVGGAWAADIGNGAEASAGAASARSLSAYLTPTE